MNKISSLIAALFIFIEALLFSLPLVADLYDVPKVNILENKLYTLRDEGALLASYLPSDAYTKYITVGAAYTHFFSEFTGWEVINAQYAIGLDSGLKKELISAFSTSCPTPAQCATADKFPTLTGLATTNLAFTPLYTKNLLFNSKNIYSQTSFVAGGGLGMFATPITNATTYKGCVDVGLVLRYFLSRSTSIMFDFRDYVFLGSNSNNQLALTVAYTLNFGGSGKK
jgi:outer membrane beta-barrel protein